MIYHKVIELDASHPKAIENTLDEWSGKGWNLSHLAVVMDSDGARYYTLILQQSRPTPSPNMDKKTLEALSK